jgi:hypothetical protein
MKETGFESIAKERIEQVVKHRQFLDADRGYKKGELVKAAQFCISLDANLWPRGWNTLYRDKIKNKSIEQRYVIAGAFLAAEVDRLRDIQDWTFESQAEKYTGWDKLVAFIDRTEDETNHRYSGTVIERAATVISRAQRETAGAMAQKKQCIEDMKIYVRGICMAAEMVAIAGTHGEKNARLRGMIELLNQTSNKLSKGYEDELLQGYRFEMYGNSDKPYQNILRKYDELKRENAELKEKLNPSPQKEETTEYPF